MKELKDFKARIDAYPGIEIFYMRTDSKFRIQAGKAAIIAELPSEKEADAFQKWLEFRNAIETQGWIEVAELFAP